MFCLVEDGPLGWVSSSRHVSIKYNTFIIRKLTHAIIDIFREHDFGVDLNRQNLLSHPLFFLLDAVFGIEKRSNFIVSFNLIECMIDNQPFWAIPPANLAVQLILGELWKRRLKGRFASVVHVWEIPFVLTNDVDAHGVPNLKARDAGHLVVEIHIGVIAFDGFGPDFELPQHNWGRQVVSDGAHAKIHHHSLPFTCDFSSMLLAWLLAKHLPHFKGLIDDFSLIFDALVLQLSQLSDAFAPCVSIIFASRTIQCQLCSQLCGLGMLSLYTSDSLSLCDWSHKHTLKPWTEHPKILH